MMAAVATAAVSADIVERLSDGDSNGSSDDSDDGDDGIGNNGGGDDVGCSDSKRQQLCRQWG